jgi:hypothetical protein
MWINIIGFVVLLIVVCYKIDTAKNEIIGSINR